jgi:hypothetical protein
MATNVPAQSETEPLDVAGGLSQRFLRSFRAQFEGWCDICRRLSLWEERRLVDEPTPEDFSEHARILKKLARTGRWVASLTQNADFPDAAAAELVAMTLQDIADRRALWHGTMTPEQREKVLTSIFDESCTGKALGGLAREADLSPERKGSSGGHIRAVAARRPGPPSNNQPRRASRRAARPLSAIPACTPQTAVDATPRMRCRTLHCAWIR